MSKINVIIPVYNAEKYLQELFDSILRQTFSDYTLIVVSDCSSDSSDEIIEKNKKEFGDKLVSHRNPINLKLGKTRNVGLEISEQLEAEYTCFVDADDWLERDYFEQLINSIEDEQSDIAICGIQRFEDETNKIVCEEAIHGRKVDMKQTKDLCQLAYLNPAAYNKIYRSKKIKGARFKPLKRSEDTCYLFEILNNIDSISYTGKIGYHYRIRESSLTGKTGVTECVSMQEGFGELLQNERIVSSNYFEEFVCQIFIRLACGGVCRASFYNIRGAQKLICDTKKYLDLYVPSWRNNKYLSFRKGVRGNLKEEAIRICAFMYKTNTFVVFIVAYYILTKLLHKDIRM